MERHSDQHPFLIPKPRCFGVRCPCGAYLAIEEIHGDPRQATCNRLERPVWIICVACGVERRYSEADLTQFDCPTGSGGAA